jgi:hypothetical protein
MVRMERAGGAVMNELIRPLEKGCIAEEAPDNRVRIPRLKHWEITGWYARPNDEFGGQSPRSHLQGADWSERYRIGIRALEDAGVLAP